MMGNTPNLFDPPPPETGVELRDRGIQKAVEHADKVVSEWSQRAYGHFIDYCKMVPQLKTEDARVYAESKGLEVPPTKRAWGAIAVRAAKNGYICRVGFVAVDNPKAHCTTVTLWEVNRAKFNQV